MFEAVTSFFKIPIPWVFLVNGILVLGYLTNTKKALRVTTGRVCRCGDKRVGGGNLFGGAAAMSFGTPTLILYIFTNFETAWVLFIIQATYSFSMFVFVLIPKLRKHGSIIVESHAFNDVSLCGMIAALNIGPFYWFSLWPPARPTISFVVDLITLLHHFCATIILGVIATILWIYHSKYWITTGWSEHKW